MEINWTLVEVNNFQKVPFFTLLSKKIDRFFLHSCHVNFLFKFFVQKHSFYSKMKNFTVSKFFTLWDKIELNSNAWNAELWMVLIYLFIFISFLFSFFNPLHAKPNGEGVAPNETLSPKGILYDIEGKFAYSTYNEEMRSYHPMLDIKALTKDLK